MVQRKGIYKKHEWLLLGLCCLILLSGCGMWDSDTKETQNITEKTVLVYSGSSIRDVIINTGASIVENTWTEIVSARVDNGAGDISDSEIINGIAVPLEPDPTINNSTLAGIDVNKNGVRDDVERKIAMFFGTNQSKWLSVIIFAKSEQSLIINPNEPSYDAYVKASLCSGLEVVDTDPITKALLNTEVRQSSYRNTLAGIVVTGDECK